MDALAELAATLVRDPAAAATTARDLAATARADGDVATASRADVIRGRAMLLLGEIVLAEQALDDAIAAARAAGDPALDAEAHLALAAVRSSAGRHADAFHALDRVEQIGPPALVERASLQRAVVCRDARRFDESLALFRAATDRMRAAGNGLDLARVLANCGGILMHQGRIDEAIADLAEAIELLRAGGHEFVALQVVHDLGCAEAYRGHLAAALARFDEAERGMAALGHDASFPLLSRAEALLRSGLTGDALAAASEAGRRLAAEGHALAALALLTAAEAARLDGDAGTALRLATRATDEFGADGTSGWERSARLEAVRARRELDQLDLGDLAVLGAIIDTADAAGDVRASIEAGALRATVAARVGAEEAISHHLDQVARSARRTGLAQLTAAVGAAQAEVALSGGDLVRARRAARRACASVAETKRMYGAGESNPALGTEGRATAEAMMLLAASEGSAHRRLAWMEAVRSLTGAAAVEVERPQQFAALRAVAAELRHAERTGEATDDLRRHQARLEAAIRDERLREWATRNNGDRSPDGDGRSGIAGLADTVGSHTVVSIGFARDRTLAVVADRRGARTVELAPSTVVREAAARTGAALRGLSTESTATIAEARRRTFAAAVDRFDELVIRPLAVRTDDVVLVVPPDLVAVPWAATATLRSRRFSLAPSVGWWRGAVASAPGPSGPPRAVVVAGPRLAYADAEARGVASCHPGATLLAGDRATVEAATEALGAHDVAHVVAHGTFRRDNPLWSTIELADGPMPVYELQQLRTVPDIIVLATCESAIAAGRGGAELQGLAAALLALGARTVVAAVGPLPDDATTRDTMIAVHRDLRAGMGAATSLALRRETTDRRGIDPTAAALVTIGVGS